VRTCSALSAVQGDHSRVSGPLYGPAHVSLPPPGVLALRCLSVRAHSIARQLKWHGCGDMGHEAMTKEHRRPSTYHAITMPRLSLWHQRCPIVLPSLTSADVVHLGCPPAAHAIAKSSCLCVKVPSGPTRSRGALSWYHSKCSHHTRRPLANPLLSPGWREDLTLLACVKIH